MPALATSGLAAGGKVTAPKASMLIGPALPQPQRRPPAFPPPWAVSWGDDRHGLWAELEVRDVVQRLRWIEPGTFLMGSPDNEPGRWADEGPQHAVRLTQGLWLADSACTQALWLAVMGGKNPSQFSDDLQCPVEQVSWDDAIGFLARLTAEWGEGDQAALPTEAEWEYACRAGTADAFHFGASATTERVNFSGKFDFGDKKPTLGEPRDRTVPVKTFAPNAWGLFEMHGNVLEWCDDSGQRRYASSDQPLDDPRDAGEQSEAAPRALRGGSWFHGARACRSASRIALVRGFRHDGVGFRLALRSSSSSPAR
jgi:formylglycine-generating enzyme